MPLTSLEKTMPPSGRLRVVQRAHAEAVAHQRERARGAVEVGDAPLPVAAVQRLRAVTVEQAQQDLGVAGRAEALALGLELAGAARSG